jgi:hypothetical protein
MIETNTTGQPGARQNQTIENIPTGSAGFDQISCCGLPFQPNSLVMGRPRNGKTIFARQRLGLSGGTE